MHQTAASTVWKGVPNFCVIAAMRPPHVLTLAECAVGSKNQKKKFFFDLVYYIHVVVFQLKNMTWVSFCNTISVHNSYAWNEMLVRELVCPFIYVERTCHSCRRFGIWQLNRLTISLKLPLGGVGCGWHCTVRGVNHRALTVTSHSVFFIICSVQTNFTLPHNHSQR